VIERLGLYHHRTIRVTAAAGLLVVWAAFAVAGWVQQDEAWRRFSAVLQSLVVVGYAIAVAQRQHPAMNLRYGRWLQRSPWRWGRRLPLGPVRPEVADGLVVLLFALLFPYGFSSGLWLGVALYYLGRLAVQLDYAATYGQPVLTLGWVVMTGLGVAFTTGPYGLSPVPLFLALVLTVALGEFLTPRVLHRFDELSLERTPRLVPVVSKPGDQLAKSPNRSVGSPWSDLIDPVDRPDGPPQANGWGRHVRVALSIVWLAGCVEAARRRLIDWSLTADPEDLIEDPTIMGTLRYVGYVLSHPELLRERFEEQPPDIASLSWLVGGIVLTLVALLVVVRLVAKHWPPINPLGRIATGRLIIPGYDYVFVGAIASFVVYAGLGWGLTRVGGFGVASGGIALAVALVVLWRLTPSRDEWRLTGHHRVMCSKPSGQRRGR